MAKKQKQEQQVRTTGRPPERVGDLAYLSNGVVQWAEAAASVKRPAFARMIHRGLRRRFGPLGRGSVKALESALLLEIRPEGDGLRAFLGWTEWFDPKPRSTDSENRYSADFQNEYRELVGNGYTVALLPADSLLTVRVPCHRGDQNEVCSITMLRDEVTVLLNGLDVEALEQLKDGIEERLGIFVPDRI